MRGLWMELPPFSPDTSGFSSVLSGSDGAGLLDDVRGCAGNYYGSEEIRTDVAVRVFVSRLGNEDAICGSEKAVLRRFAQIYETLRPRFAVLASSPIAALIGTDLPAICEEITQRWQIPACWVPTEGYGTYDAGISRTLCQLAERFAADGGGQRQGVNLIGANYLDWTPADMLALRAAAEAATGEEVRAVLGGALRFAELQAVGQARWNWVVNAAGLECARILKEKFGTPYVCAAPFGAAALLRPEAAQAPAVPPPGTHGPKTLIVAEQYAANALRALLFSEFGFTDVTVASFFMMDGQRMLPGDRRLLQEDELRAFAEAERFACVIGDGMLRPCLPRHTRLIGLPQLPISSRLYADLRPALLGDKACVWLETQLRERES